MAATGTHSWGAAAAIASAQSVSRPGCRSAGCCGTLDDDDVFGFVVGQLDRLVEQRFVGDQPGRLDAAGRGDDKLGPGIVDTDGQFRRGKAAEDDAMYRAETGAGEGGDQRLRHHWHVDDDPVALGHAAGGEGAGAAGG